MLSKERFVVTSWNEYIALQIDPPSCICGDTTGRAKGEPTLKALRSTSRPWLKPQSYSRPRRMKLITLAVCIILLIFKCSAQPAGTGRISSHVLTQFLIYTLNSDSEIDSTVVSAYSTMRDTTMIAGMNCSEGLLKLFIILEKTWKRICVQNFTIFASTCHFIYSWTAHL